MRDQIHFIEIAAEGRLAIMPRPPGGEELAAALQIIHASGIEVIVSLVEQHEANTLGLTEEGRWFGELGGELLHHPVPDRQAPTNGNAFAALAAQLAGRIRGGTGVGAHCWGGIGRSGMLVCAIQCELGIAVTEAMERASRARTLPVPETPNQINWLHQRYG